MRRFCRKMNPDKTRHQQQHQQQMRSRCRSLRHNLPFTRKLSLNKQVSFGSTSNSPDSGTPLRCNSSHKQGGGNQGVPQLSSICSSHLSGSENKHQNCQQRGAKSIRQLSIIFKVAFNKYQLNNNVLLQFLTPYLCKIS